jgi:hypothetical protein
MPRRFSGLFLLSFYIHGQAPFNIT